MIETGLHGRSPSVLDAAVSPGHDVRLCLLLAKGVFSLHEDP